MQGIDIFPLGLVEGRPVKMKSWINNTSNKLWIKVV